MLTFPLFIELFMGCYYPGDIFVTSKDDTNKVDINSSVIIVSISGVPSYLGRGLSREMIRASSRRKQELLFRTQLVNSLNNAEDFSQVVSLLRANHIAWYVSLSPPKWDLGGKLCVFKSGKFVVYHS